ncbi:MAG: hypothetical protein U0U67_08345 [Chitinophagales bacterium]
MENKNEPKVITLKYSLSILFLLFCLSSFSQTTFVVWQGFEHRWTYNHRLNRLGDYVSQSSDSTNTNAEITHASATGLGKDSAYFTSRYAIVESNAISFFAGKETFELKGNEGQKIELKKNILFTPNKNLQQKDIYTSILNGFDIVSVDDADKPQSLQIDISEPIYDTHANKIHFTITAALNVDCKSLECPFFNNTFNYQLDVHYLILGGNKNELDTQTISYENKLKWNTKAEIKPILYNKSIPINSDFKNGFLAYKSISIALDQEHHYLAYENSIQSTTIKNNQVNLSMYLFFSNWSSAMKHSVASGGQALFSNKKSGWCILSGHLYFIQFNNGVVTYHSRNGSQFWIGKNKSALDNTAKSTKTILLK